MNVPDRRPLTAAEQEARALDEAWRAMDWDGYPAARARAMWAQCLLLAIEDALDPRGPMKASQRVSLGWFSTRDFRQVCALCDADPEAVMDRLRPHLIDAERQKR